MIPIENRMYMSAALLNQLYIYIYRDINISCELLKIMSNYLERSYTVSVQPFITHTCTHTHTRVNLIK